MVYGSTLPVNSFSVTSGTLAFTETISGVTYTYSTNPPRNVGTYDITPSAAVVAGGSANNYEITYVKGELEVTKADLTIYISNANSDWGDKVSPAGASSSEGLKNNDKLGTFNYTFDGSETAPAMPGEYALDGTVATFAAGTADNYNITIVPATYTINAPFFVNIDPKRGPVAGGTRFTINGFGFGLTNPIVRFDGLDATEVTLVGSTQISGVTPPHAEGLVAVTLITDHGTLELGEVFTYFPPKPTPQILALAPAKGTTAGGTKVTMSGSAFKGSNGKPAKIYVNGVLATGIKVSKSGNTIEFITPPNPTGPMDIKVETNDGSFTYADGFEYIPGAKTSKAVIIFNGDSSVLLAPGIASLNKLLKGIPKGATIVSVNVNGWVKRTASTAIDAKLSLARATVTANFLKRAGVKTKITLNGKGIYRLGNDQDRRAEIEIVWIK
jgi:outer membrane protein OmpA-like peptidoglycan-associated protein